MNHRTLKLKVLYTTSTLTGFLLVGVPVYGQMTASGVVVPATSLVNAPPVIQVPAAPLFAAQEAPGALADPAAFTAWVAAHQAVPIGVGVLAPTPEAGGDSHFILYRFAVTDADGADDIQEAQAKLLLPDGSVHTAFTAAIPLGTSSPLTKEYYAEFELKSTDPPAIGANFYRLVIQVSDAAIEADGLPYIDDEATAGLFQYQDLANVKPVVDVLEFGTLKADEKSAGVPVTLVNLGNVVADTTLSATDFVFGESVIPASNIWYGPTQAAAGTNFPDAAANPKRDAGFNLAPGATRTAYLAIDVPADAVAGVYDTVIQFTGVQHNGSCTSDCVTVEWS